MKAGNSGFAWMPEYKNTNENCKTCEHEHEPKESGFALLNV